VQTSAEWRAERRATIAKFAGAAVFLVIPLVVTDQKLAWLLGILAAAGLTIYGLRDVLAPVRLAADADGLTVASGYAGHRRLTWSELDRVRVDSRTRLGARSAFLEVDAGESLYFFSRYDLSADPDDVLKVIEEIHPDVNR
jgi:PH (Pleckstrin Homology) domain-containing protein